MSRWTQTLEERFWSKVQGGDVDECWLWTASLTSTGYGQFMLNGRPHKAHRVAYELMIADIPAGLQIDHLCRNRLCVNPWHLDPVTNEVNTARGMFHGSGGAVQRGKTHCPHGHPYDETNTYRRSNGERNCRTCERGRSLRNYYRRKATA